MTYLRTPRRALSIVLAAAAIMALALPVAAVDTITQVITAGQRSASVADLTLGSISYQHTAQTSTGTMVLTADDSTGSNLGWNVTIVSSDFVRTGGGTSIPAANFSLTSAAEPTANAGQAVDTDTDGVLPTDTANGPMVPAISPVGTLDSARKTVQANPTYGNGNYSQNLGVSLSIPGQTAAGTYTGTLTTTISAAP